MISMNQVNVFLRRCYINNQSLRKLHNGNLTENILHPLDSRGLLKVSGDDTSAFLQGLITNDMQHFDTGAKSIYAMFLNNKGRVLYDTLIHKWDKANAFVIECDCKLVNLLLKHLKMFKLRRNIQIEDLSKDYTLWAVTQSSIPDIHNNDKISVYKDPRLTELGLRIITSNNLKSIEVAKYLGNDMNIEKNEDNYTYLRYRLGVSEGANDLTPGTCFPLEANCDYLHGVSFHKGCYIGQEVTARVHHTGVVRKRIMPLKFTETVPENIEHDSTISSASDDKKHLGKLKGVIKDYGIGLMRIKETLDTQSLKINEYTLESYKPSWWPIEAPKEILKENESI